jgi:AAA domain
VANFGPMPAGARPPETGTQEFLLRMKHAFFLAPAGRGQGLTTVALGVVEALDRRGVRVAFYKPIDEGIE